MINSKEMVIEYLRKHSEQLDVQNMRVFSTAVICASLHMSRTLTSQYLNELSKENKAVKINSRPVYYVDAKTLEQMCGGPIPTYEFLSITEFQSFLTRNKEILHDFKKAIGYQGSLYNCISQMKSAIVYPPYGLQILLYGKKGSGKRYLVKLLYEYAMNQHIFSKHSSLVEMEIKKEQTQLMQEMFGPKGILATMQEGVLHLMGAERMSEDFQEQLQERLHQMQGTPKQQLRIILSMNTERYDSINDSLLFLFPIKCQIPSYRERYIDEKEDFILYFLKQEQKKIQQPISLSTTVFQTLLHTSYIDGIMELKSCIKMICANAYAKRDEKETTCTIRMLHLPADILEKAELHKDPIKERSFLLDEYHRQNEQEELLHVFDELLEAFQAYQEQELSFSQFLSAGQGTLRKYYDYLVFEQQKENAQFKAVEKLIQSAIRPILQENAVSLPLNFVFVLTHILLANRHHDSTMYVWQKQRYADIEVCLQALKMELGMEYALTQSLSTILYESIDFKLNTMDQLFMMLNINFYNRDLQQQNLHGIIISHGHCTASSIADAVNQLLETTMFEAIDMPLNMSFSEIEHVLNHQIELHPRWKHLILMVDMGSLEEIGSHVHANIKVGVINNISTGLALEVGQQMMQHRQIEEILPDVCERSACRYRLIQPQKKEKAILFTNDAGIEISRRLSNLFRSSLPKNVNVRFIEYEYEQLMKNHETDIVFNQYDVVLVVKPYDLYLQYHNCVELEDIINFKEIHKVDDALRSDLNEAEIGAFHEQLLKNFSLQNIMENLTILNPKKLLDFVSASVLELQQRMQVSFQSKTMVGIYIHVSLLIERLVTNKPIEYHGDLHTFSQEQATFIQQVIDSFALMMQHYSVEIPLSEIYYLYNYILND